MKSNRIGSVVKDLLSKANGVTGVYALIAGQGARFPYVIYERSSVSPTYAKRSIRESEFDIVKVIVAVFDKTYEGSIATMDNVHEAIQGKSGMFGDLEVKSIMLVDSTEDFDSDVYQQIHTYEFIIY